MRATEVPCGRYRLLDVYTEQGARAILARARKRGQRRTMFSCGNHWHVLVGESGASHGREKE